MGEVDKVEDAVMLGDPETEEEIVEEWHRVSVPVTLLLLDAQCVGLTDML